jgi:hypothetical protein
MARLMEFVGERWTPEYAERALQSRRTLGLGDWKTYGRKTIDPSSVARWKKLSRDTINRLGTICNPTLSLCGYDPIELHGDAGTDEVRRRLEIGLLLQRMKAGSGKTPAEKPTPSSRKTRDA